MDVGLKRELEEKVRSGERLSREDGIALYESDDLAWLGGLAHEVRTRKNGDVVHFNVNRHLNMTNVCTASCARYCPSSRQAEAEKDAYDDAALRGTAESESCAKARMEAENLGRRADLRPARLHGRVDGRDRRTGGRVETVGLPVSELQGRPVHRVHPPRGEGFVEAVRAGARPVLPADRQLWAGLTAFFTHTARHPDGWAVLHLQARTHGEVFAAEVAAMRADIVTFVTELILAAAREALPQALGCSPKLSPSLEQGGPPRAGGTPTDPHLPGGEVAGLADEPGPAGTRRRAGRLTGDSSAPRASRGARAGERARVTEAGGAAGGTEAMAVTFPAGSGRRPVRPVR
ncbi:Aminodeoxyfutalosine synthase [Streptomyces hirsutus]